MPRYGTLGDYRFSDTKEAANDIRGAKIYGRNSEKLGEIEDVVFDQDTGAIVYVVVDTGGWLSSHKFLVPPGKIRPSVQHRDDYLVDLTKEQIEGFPPYDGAFLSSDEKWDDYERRYHSKWADRPVTNRVGTGSENAEDIEDDEDLEVTPITTDASMEVSPAGPSLRWTSFEDKLRERREEVLDSSIKAAERRKAS